MNTTIVSSLYMGVNKYRSIEDYINYGRKLLSQQVNKIIYIEREVYDMYYADDQWEANTTFRYITAADVYLNAYDEYVTEFDIITNHPEKDTKEYMYLMCNKTEWVKEAILLNYFKTENFIWVDFGIRHVFSGTDEAFIEKINALNSKMYSGVRIGAIWNLNSRFNIDVYKDIAWYFAGGVFGGNANSLIKFSELMKDKCIDIMTNKNTIMWEVNIWYLIYTENQDIFDVYYCNHDNSIITNY